jgi:hypothetical protein
MLSHDCEVVTELDWLWLEPLEEELPELPLDELLLDELPELPLDVLPELVPVSLLVELSSELVVELSSELLVVLSSSLELLVPPSVWLCVPLVPDEPVLEAVVEVPLLPRAATASHAATNVASAPAATRRRRMRRRWLMGDVGRCMSSMLRGQPWILLGIRSGSRKSLRLLFAAS